MCFFVDVAVLVYIASFLAPCCVGLVLLFVVLSAVALPALAAAQRRLAFEKLAPITLCSGVSNRTSLPTYRALPKMRQGVFTVSFHSSDDIARSRIASQWSLSILRPLQTMSFLLVSDMCSCCPCSLRQSVLCNSCLRTLNSIPSFKPTSSGVDTDPDADRHLDCGQPDVVPDFRCR